MRNPAVQSRTLTELSEVFGNYNKTFEFIFIFRILESDTREQCVVYTTWPVLVLKTPMFLTSFWFNQVQNIAEGKEMNVLASWISEDERPTIPDSARVVKFKASSDTVWIT